MNLPLEVATPEYEVSHGVLDGLFAQPARSGRDAATPEEHVSQIAAVKRFVECYLGDAEFRRALHRTPEEGGDVASVLETNDLRVHPQDVCAYLRSSAVGKSCGETSSLRLYREFVSAVACEALAINARAASSSNQAYAAWRRRQLGALRFHFSALAEHIVHPVAAFELSRGCSVGCWFCAVGAEKLQGHFVANQENLTMFQSAQRAMRELLGEAAGASMCYWATDPLDNPEYEVFAQAFYREHRVFPPTTTAIAWKDPSRTRALLQASAARGTHLNRFSVLSAGMLKRIHAVFSPEELLQTELVFQMPEALVSVDLLSHSPARKVRAGRARTFSDTDDRVYEEGAGTVACVIGFLVNFVDGTVRLIAPTLPSQTWPLGYRTLAQAHGTTSESFSSVIQGMIRDHMAPGFGEQPLHLGPLLEAETTTGGLHLRSPKHAVMVAAPGLSEAALRLCVDLLRSGSETAAGIASALRKAGVSLLHSQSFLHGLRAEGVFDLV